MGAAGYRFTWGAKQVLEMEKGTAKRLLLMSLKDILKIVALILSGLNNKNMETDIRG